MKKKLILMLCVAALTLSFASCGDTDKGSKDNESAASSASETVESKADESEAETTEESAAEAESAAEVESKAEATESKADSDKPAASNEELTELLAKVKETTADSKNCEMTAKMNIDMVMTMSGTTTNMKTNTDMVSKTNGKNTHTTQTTTTDQGQGSPITETQDIYQAEDGNTYISTDEGKTWVKSAGPANSFNADAFSNEVIGDEGAFKNATLEKDGDNYVITISLNDILENGGEVAESLFGMGGGGKAEGNMIMTIGSDYYPVSIAMENIAFDMSELLSSLSSEDTGDISMDMTMNMTLNFSNWGGVSDDEVAVPEAALSAQ